MVIEVATHSGSFHADDVLAFAMIREFVDADAEVVRTRSLKRIRKADIAVDVGGEFDPGRGRFDHHQGTYTGDRSSAGMVLDWIEAEGKVEPDTATALRNNVVAHVDAVDIGRRSPKPGIPCFSSIVGMLNNTSRTEEEYLSAYLGAVDVARIMLRGIVAGHERIKAARSVVRQAMAEAVATKRRVLFLDDYYVWKPAYFENKGIDHPTDYVVFETEGKCRIVAIPPAPGSFDKKRALPKEWAGLTDQALSDAVGVPGAVFCHKNRFIAVFDTREAALAALQKWDLIDDKSASSNSTDAS